MKIELTSKNATLPTYGSDGAAGMDLYAAHAGKYITIPAREGGIVPIGIRVKIPEGHYAKIQPRSGLAVKNGIDVMAGVIDNDYRGEIGVVLFNHSYNDFIVEQGSRIAQMIITPYVKVDFEEGEVTSETERGEGGFGSTGV